MQKLVKSNSPLPFKVYKNLSGFEYKVYNKDGVDLYPIKELATCLGLNDHQAIRYHLKNIRKEGLIKDEVIVKIIFTLAHHNSKTKTRNVPVECLTKDIVLMIAERVTTPEARLFRLWLLGHGIKIANKGFSTESKIVARDPMTIIRMQREALEARIEEQGLYEVFRKLLKQICIDYDSNSKKMRWLFAVIQNLIYLAETGKTARGLQMSRIDGEKDNCGLTVHCDGGVKKKHLKVAKNTLDRDELAGIMSKVLIMLTNLNDMASRNVKRTSDELIKMVSDLLNIIGYKVCVEDTKNDHSETEVKRHIDKEHNIYQKQLKSQQNLGF